MTMKLQQDGETVKDENVTAMQDATEQPEQLLQQQQQPPQPQTQQQQQQPPPSIADPTAEAKEKDKRKLEVESLLDATGKVKFPMEQLNKLEELISGPRWVVPVLPGAELEQLLVASIQIVKAGLDDKCEAFHRFINNGCLQSFNKIFNDDAVINWKPEIHKCIFDLAKLLLQLIVLRFELGEQAILDMLYIILNPDTRFHHHNESKLLPQKKQQQLQQLQQQQSEKKNDQDASQQQQQQQQQADKQQQYAIGRSQKPSMHWLADLVNTFGQLGGFDRLRQCLQHNDWLSVGRIAGLLRPFGASAEMLTNQTVQVYFLPNVPSVQQFIAKLSEADFKREGKSEKHDLLAIAIRSLQLIMHQLPDQISLVRSLEELRLGVILRVLQLSSFNGRMNALNELNKAASISDYPMMRQRDSDIGLPANCIAEWIQQHQVLSIVLKENLHQPQYAEKVEKLIRFMAKEKRLTTKDLDKIWEAQVGKHEAIVKNVHDLLAKLAWDFTPEQLDHLFVCFQVSWNNAEKKERERLLELIRRLAEEDKEGVMAQKVLELLWQLAHSPDCAIDIMDQALSAHIKILDFGCSQDREQQKLQWIARAVAELNDEKWILPALKHIRDICCLFQEAPHTYPNYQRTQQTHGYRSTIISKLDSEHAIVAKVADNLQLYMQTARKFAEEHPQHTHLDKLPNDRYNHATHVMDRLKFMRFLLKDGALCLKEQQAVLVWQCLAENPVYNADREACFKWFTKLTDDEADLDPEIMQQFFEQQVLQLEPQLLTEAGIDCFQNFFRLINLRAGKFIINQQNIYMDDISLIGIDYLWRIAIDGSDEVAGKAAQLIKGVYTQVGPKLSQHLAAIRSDFINTCLQRLQCSTSELRTQSQTQTSTAASKQIVRVLHVLCEFIAEADDRFTDWPRRKPPLRLASRGDSFCVLLRQYQYQQQQQGGRVATSGVNAAFASPAAAATTAAASAKDIELWLHSNQTVGSMRRWALRELQPIEPSRIDLYFNNECLMPSDADSKLIGEFGITHLSVVSIKLIPLTVYEQQQPQQQLEPDLELELELSLPGVILASSAHPQVSDALLDLVNIGCELHQPQLADSARQLLQLMPAHHKQLEQMEQLCGGGDGAEQLLCNGESPSHCAYNLQVLYTLIYPAGDADFETETATAIDRLENFLAAGGIEILLRAAAETQHPGLHASTWQLQRLWLMKLLRVGLTASAFACWGTLRKSKLNDNDAAANEANEATVTQLSNCLDCVPQDLVLKQHCSLAGSRLKMLTPKANVLPIVRLLWACAALKPHLAATDDPTDAGAEDATQKLHAAVIEAGELSVNADSSQTMLATSASSDPIEAALALTTPDAGDSTVAELAALCFESLALLLSLQHKACDSLCRERYWQQCVLDCLLLCPNAIIRNGARHYLEIIATKCSVEQRTLTFFTTLLFYQLNQSVQQNKWQSDQLFALLERLLRSCRLDSRQLGNADKLLTNELQWLRTVKANYINNSVECDQILLQGHLLVCKELVYFCPQRRKYLGSEPSGQRLIAELLDDFLFPAAKLIGTLVNNQQLPRQATMQPLCNTPMTSQAAFDLLVALCTDCPDNLRCLANRLVQMYYSDEQQVYEWEYLPPVCSKPAGGFVGLKNAGATCYMNSVLQQLFMTHAIRNAILSIDSGDCSLLEEEELLDCSSQGFNNNNSSTSTSNNSSTGSNYNLKLLQHVQLMFGQLACSQLQYHTPRGLWSHFRLWGDPVNLREQHDALEFLTCLVDSVDEAMKSLGQPKLIEQVLGGTFADQKICKDCPHRYSREEPFTVLSVDVRNQHSLRDSLEQYVKGDLLEGDNAYMCERCGKKVDTVKRLLIKKLPPLLAIQLKRFDYDWEKDVAVKFNDYFEFPRHIDMEPYTVQGLAKIEGEQIEEEGGVG